MDRTIKIFCTTILWMSSCCACAQTVSKVWVADSGDGTYKNPILHADYSDPDAIRVSDTYYMIASSFQHAPGLPILASKDLVNWKIIGHALPFLQPAEHFREVQHGNGVWAPSLRYHNKEFFLYYPDPDYGIFLLKAKNILGPWSSPILVEAGKGLIDPCPLWDDDGKVYLVHAFANSRAGIKSILVVKQLNADGTKVISDSVRVFDGHRTDPTVEGPKFYKRNGYYYIFAPAGGVPTGWQLVLRSKNVYGPYERKVVMDQGTTKVNGPHQGAWVTTSTGEDWFIHFQDEDAYGRIVHLQPMNWVNDWPVIGIDREGDGKGEPVLQYRKPNVGRKYPVQTPQESDEFSGKTLNLQWQWNANPQSSWYSFVTPGFLRLFAIPSENLNSIWMTPSILEQKLPAETFEATVKLTMKNALEGERFGLTIYGLDYASIVLTKKGNGVSVSYVQNKKADKDGEEKVVIEEAFPRSGDQWLRVRVDSGCVCHFGWSADGKQFTIYEKAFVATPGKWVGATLGIYCRSSSSATRHGFADVDWFHIDPAR